jgi:outer membrane protein TolC
VNLLLLALLAPAVVPDAPLTPDDCVRLALAQNAQIEEAEAKVAGARALLRAVEANYGPRLNAVGWVAPMFTVEGSALGPVTRRWKSPGDWGPYVHLESVLAKPLYTFGRVEAGEEAARARLRVEQARVTAAEAAIATEVRTLYHAHLFARSMLPSLKLGARIVGEALEKAEAMYAAGEGITQVDLGRLRYGQSEVQRLTRIAEDGAALALDALKHTMRLPHSTPLTLAWARLPAPDALPALADAQAEALEHRPEWAMLREGEAAAQALARAERLANAPTVFAAGTFNFDWAPTRDDSDNPYHRDPFNIVTGGVAVGLQWDFQPLRARARAESAEARGAEVMALKAFAQTGIPLEVFRAHQMASQQGALARQAKIGVKAARKWFTFAGNAYKSGTGDARDILEGLVSLLSAKRTYYQHLRGHHDARAHLARATGRHRPGDLK